MTQRRAADIEASQSALRSTTGQLQEGLYQVLYGMLRHGGDTREAVVAWLAAYCNNNAGGAGGRGPGATATPSLSSTAASLSVPEYSEATGSHLTGIPQRCAS